MAQEASVAFPITPSIPVEGNINNDNPTDRFSFEAIAGDEITIDLRSTSGDLDPFLLLFNASETLLESNDDAEAGNRNARITFTIPENGQYLIEATRFDQEVGDTSGTYLLSLNLKGVLSNTNESDPFLRQPLFGVDFTITDYDHFSLSPLSASSPTFYTVLPASQGDYAQIQTSLTGNLKASVQIFDEGLNLVSNSEPVSEDQILTTATFPRTGWYLIETRWQAGVGELTQVPFLVADSVIEDGAEIEGLLSIETPRRSYIFDGKIGDRIFLSARMQNETSAIFPVISLYDLDRNLIAERIGDSAQTRLRTTLPRSGTYILEVSRPVSAQGSENFTFNMRLISLDLSKLALLPINYNSRVKGHIDDKDPLNYYQFSGKAGELVTAEMMADISIDEQISSIDVLDPYLILLDEQLNEIASNDNVGSRRNARILQQALPADGLYYLVASRSGLNEGSTFGDYHLDLTVGQLTLNEGELTVTLQWNSPVDLNLFVRTPDGQTMSWSNPQLPDGGRLQIDSNNNCETPTAQPLEHMYWDNADLVSGTYTIWVWHQNSCGFNDRVPFVLTVQAQGEEVLRVDDPKNSLRPDERFESLVYVSPPRVNVVDNGRVTKPSAQQQASQGGDVPINVGQSLTDKITNEVYAHFYQLQANAGETYIIKVETLTGNLDPMLVIRNEQDQNLALNDDSGDSKNATLTYTFEESGRYIIAVTRYGLRDGTSTGDFRLSVAKGY
ncbi:hypothetical protein MASR2M15_25840 [Anaerolineales bacterium]